MKISLYLPTGLMHELGGQTDAVAAFETLAELARAAEETGYASVWAPDHFVTLPPAPSFVFENWTTLTALARDTSRVRLGQLVTGNSYRHPALQAKMASTLDVISRGRFTFGIGAGWYEDEYRSYGYEYPDGPDRLRRLREAVQIIQSMWTETRTTFEGTYYQVRDAINEPKGVQSPRVPMMIAGAGEKVTLKLVAQYGDACNIMASPDELKRKYGVLRDHCDAVGRDFGQIVRTASSYCIMADTDERARAAVPPWAPAVFPGDLGSYGLVGTPDTIRERLAAYEDAGVQELIVSFHEALDPNVVRRFASEFLYPAAGGGHAFMR
ncbi:LLM class F420-dependent oxidoreductase [Nonomuraea sp. NPDC050783]|uniref:LLM class F420-dependent oxidoreductase n=1 Tax=Nonomuraea sp. NPDC050783 TaxID=3154634 RepID=UPI003465C1AF